MENIQLQKLSQGSCTAGLFLDMWTALWVARIITNVLIAVIPGINENNPVLVVLGFSVPLKFASTTMLACALSFVQLSTVRNWFTEHFPRRGRDEKLMYLYRITLFSYGLRMLALFLYDSFLVARAITRERQFRELDSLLLALDVGYRGSLTVFFFFANSLSLKINQRSSS